MKNRWLILILIIYIILYSFNLSKYPRIGLDEALFSNPAYTLLTKGTFGTEILHGWHNIQNNTFWQPPVSLLILFPSFKIFGFGILQARAVMVLFGLVSLIFTYKLADRLYGEKVALFSIILMVFNPVNFWIFRGVRPEAAVTVFLLIAFYSIVVALESNSKKYFFISGFFAALGFLSHPNGLHGIIAIFLIMVIKKIYDSRLWIYALGVLIPGMTYLIYVLTDFNNYKAQSWLAYGSNAATIPQNIIMEYKRYIVFIGIYGQGFIENELLFYAKLAFFLILFSLLIYYIARRRTESDNLIMVLVLTYLGLFTILVGQKVWWYFGIILPYISILIASIVAENTPRGRIFKVFKMAVAIFLIMNIIHIGFSLYITRDYDYDVTVSKIKDIIPVNSTILAPSELWIGMSDYKFYDTTVIHLRATDNKEKISDIMLDLNPDYVIMNKTWRYPGVFDSYDMENNSVKITSVSYRKSLSSNVLLDIYKMNKLR